MNAQTPPLGSPSHSSTGAGAISDAGAEPSALSAGERSAFHELARRLTARLSSGGVDEARSTNDATVAEDPVVAAVASAPPARTAPAERHLPETALLDKLPVGLLVYRFDHLLYANKAFLTWTGYPELEALRAAGGLDSLAVSPRPHDGDGQSFSIDGRAGVTLPYEARLLDTAWAGDSANALILVDRGDGARATHAEPAQRSAEVALRTAEDALAAANKEAKSASLAQAGLLAKIGRRIRAPLSAISESAAAMASQQFGPLGHDRYRDYLTDISAGGERTATLVDNLIRLTNIEAGRIELSSVDVHLNDMVQSCVSALQADATRDRVIIRTSLAPGLRPVVADADTIREVLDKLVAHSLRLTGPGGQVIISTAQNGDGDVVLHVRDTGIGMSETELRGALDAFHTDEDTTAWDASGATLTLPLAKALAEANHATFKATSTPNVGTLVEIAFPAKRVLER